jgi:hypothetical protein
MFSNKFEIPDNPKIRKARELETIKGLMISETD